MTRVQCGIIAALSIGVVFVVCVLSLVILAQNVNLTQVFAPAIPSQTYCDDSSYFQQTNTILGRWTDATTRASSTARIALTSVVGDMQQIRRDYADLSHPACANRMHQLTVASMNDEIDGYLLFMQQASDSSVSDRMKLASDEMIQAMAELQRIHGSQAAVPTQIPATSSIDITVTATDFRDDPSTVVVNSSQVVRLTFRNQGSVQHTLVIPQLGVRMVADPGASSSTSFTAGDIGTYPFYCNIAGHREAGESGQLLVR